MKPEKMILNLFEGVKDKNNQVASVKEVRGTNLTRNLDFCVVGAIKIL